MHFDRCVRSKMNKEKMDAIILANALIFSSPSETKQSASKKERNWNKFISLLDYEKMKEKSKEPKFTNLVGVLQSLKVPLKPKKDDH